MLDNEQNETLNSIPHHIAFIADGNRRWAYENNCTAAKGHFKGALKCMEVFDICLSLGVKTMTCFILSQENIQRNIKEINNLMRIIHYLMRPFVHLAFNKKMKVNFLGDTKNLNPSLIKKFRQIEIDTQHNAAMTINIAIGYGGKWDITQSAQQLVDKALKNELKDNLVTEQLIQDHLMLRGQKSPDLLIRTGGYKRLSNFLLWDIAYTELYFIEKYWPDINLEDIQQIISHYQTINKNNGK